MSPVTPSSFRVRSDSGVGSQSLHPDRICASTAASQYGLLNHAQTQAAGVSAKAVGYRRRTGRYERVLPKVERVGGAADCWEQQVVGALLWAGEGSAASHRCAAGLWRFDSCGRDLVEITTPRNLRSEDGKHVLIHRYSSLLPDEVETIGSIRVTAPARTLLDLAAVVPTDRLEIAMDSALRRKQTTLPELRLALSRNARRGRRGVQAFRRSLDLRDSSYVPPHPGLERKLRALIESSDLPQPLREYPVIQNGKEIYRLDFAYPDRMLAIEADSWEHHSDRISWSKDQGRGNVLTPLGWRVLHFTHEHVTVHPAYVIDTIRKSL